MARTRDWHVGDKARVIKLDEIGVVTYVDRELISVRLSSHKGPRAYWRSEVEHVKEDALDELIGE